MTVKLKREKILLVLMAGIVSLFLFDKFLLGALRERWKEVESEIRARERTIRKYESVLRRYEHMASAQGLYLWDVGSATGTLRDSADFLQQIEKIARDTGLRIVEIKPLPETVDKNLRVMRMTLEGESNWGSAVDFLAGLGKAKPIYHVDQLTLRSRKNQQALSLRVVLVQYFMAGSTQKAGKPTD